jgi:hypothetical protein
MMDRLYLPFLALVAVALAALAMVWPQGLGDRSPGPFGKEPVQRTAAMQAAMKRETAASEQRLEQARRAVREIQTRKIDPAP